MNNSYMRDCRYEGKGKSQKMFSKVTISVLLVLFTAFYSYGQNVTTGNATSVTSITATLTATVENPEGKQITEQGFKYSSSSANLNNIVSGVLNGESLTAELSGLAVGTTYYYRAYVVAGGNTINGDMMSFTTTSSLTKNNTGHFIPDGPNCTEQCYTSTLSFSNFGNGEYVTNADDIKYIRLNIEHSFIGDLHIEVLCPNGQSALILQDYYSNDNASQLYNGNAIDEYIYNWPNKDTVWRIGPSEGTYYESQHILPLSYYSEERNGQHEDNGTIYYQISFETESEANYFINNYLRYYYQGYSFGTYQISDFYIITYFENSETYILWLDRTTTTDYSSAYKFSSQQAAQDFLDNVYEGNGVVLIDLISGAYSRVFFGAPDLFDVMGDGTNACDEHDEYNLSGVGYDYAWTSSSQYSTNGYVYDFANTAAPATSYTNGTIQSSSGKGRYILQSNVETGSQMYQPYESFNNFIGCPINGTWTITVCDSWANDNGYLFDWKIKFLNEPISEPTGTHNNHGYVDLGLPSGTRWATTNVGAENPEDYGDYYAWGETEPHYSDGGTTDNPTWLNGYEDGYSWTTYRYCNGSESTLTKYCNDSEYGDNGFTDTLTTLESTDDAATANWGAGWRMPTQEELQELDDNCIREWTEQNGVSGYLFTGPNGNSIFLPAAGTRPDSELYSAGSNGYYRSSSLYSDDTDFAWGLDFYSDYYGMSYDYRYYGFTVRAVCDTTIHSTSYAPSVTTQSATDLTATSATLHATITSDGGADITSRGFIYGTDSNNLTETVQSTDEIANFAYTLTGLTPLTTYYYKAFATNSEGTSYGLVQNFTTPGTQGAVGTFYDSRNDITYATITIGDQTWMAENLRYEGDIPLGNSNLSSTDPQRSYPSSMQSTVTKYGYLYNWLAVMNGESSSNTNPSEVQGICPSGWHLPSDLEWTHLTDYLGGDEYAGAMLAGDADAWLNEGQIVSSEYFGTSGFNALPAGGNYGGNDGFYDETFFWTATENSSSEAYYRHIDKYGLNISRSYDNKNGEYSVRCVKNGDNTANSDIPFSCDFEDTDENANWTLANGTQTNQWHIGTAASHGGDNSLYISNDDGTSNAYTLNTTSYVYAYRNLNIAEDGVYMVSFDWLGQGESNYDLLRAFITPTSAVLEAGSANGMTSSNNTTPNGWTDIANPEGKLNNTSEWQQSEKETYLEAGTYNLVFFWKNDNSGGSQPPAAIDNLSITKVSCPSVADITVSEITIESASISWTERGSAGNWEIIVSNTALDETQLESYADVETATSTTYSATGLSPATTYYVYVRAACSADEKSLWTSTSFTSGQNHVSLPYTCDFENADENQNWALINGDQTNKWYIGAAASNGGSNGLYVTNDLGTSNAYTTNATSYVYAYRTIEFSESDTYNISFDWKANGQSNYDLLRAFIVPTSAALEAGNANGMSSYTITTPNGWIDVANPEGQLNLATEWQQSAKETHLEAGTYNLVFFWKNNNTSGSQPPAAIDNLNIKKVTCLSVTNIRTSSITTSSAYINWHESADASTWEVIVSDTELSATALENYTDATVLYDSSYNATGLNPGTKYYAYIRAVCSDSDKSLWQNKTFKTNCNTITVSAENPYSEDFNSYSGYTTGTTAPTEYPSHTMPHCWEFANMSENTSTYPQIFLTSSSTYAVSGNCLFFKSNSTIPAYAVLPTFSNSIENLSLEFTYKNEGVSTSNGTLHVGISNDISDLDASYVDIKSFEQTTTQTTEVVNFATETALTGEYYIVFKYVGGNTNNYYMSIDDVSVRFLSSDAEITAFTFAEDAEIANINSDAATITSVVSYSTASLDGLVPTITVSSGASVSPESGVAQDFTSPVTYIVTAENSTTKEWTVSVSKAAGASSANSILSFTFDGQLGESVIDADSHTVTAYAEWYCDISNIIPAITVSPQATINPESGVAQDFTNPVSYTVTAEDVSSQTWTVTVLPDPNACPNPLEIIVSNIREETATISWVQRYLETSYNVKVSSTEMLDMTATADIFDNEISSTTLDLTGLTLEETYYVYVQSACGAEGWVEATFRTYITPATIPYTCDFEEITENDKWKLANGTQANQWYIGAAANNGGENGLYITNDNGVSNAYTNNMTTYVYAHRNFEVTANAFYKVSFDWKANGEGNYDNLRAFIVPTSLNPNLSGGTSNGMTSSNNTTPTGWIDGGLGVLKGSSEWQNANFETGLQAGTYYLVFFWKNDNSGGNNPPAAIDNIEVTRLFPVVETSTATDITNTSATLNGNLLYSDYSEVTSRGFMFGTESNNLTQNFTSTNNSTAFTYELTGLEANTKYYYQAYATIDGETKYGEIKTFNVANGQQGSYYYVDLGLPSGTMWATCNVGATSPEDFGNYYAWGETEPKETYDWSTYRYCNGSENTLTKYCSDEVSGNNGFTDGLTTLEASDDAATVNWGEGWRMPTTLDIDELVFKCTFETIEQNGVLGSLVTGPNGNCIFLPAAGTYQNNRFYEEPAYYWSSTTDIFSNYGFVYSFYNEEYESRAYFRQYGNPVRPIYRTAPTTSVSGTQSYYCDFEDEAENFKWIIDTSTTTLENKWYIGPAANNGGNNGLYISNDNGASNVYNGSSWTYTYTYRSFEITENDFYEASFDWRAMGASTTQLMRAFIIPMSQNPYLKQTALSQGNVMPDDNNDAPDGWIDGGLGILNRHSEWQHASIQAQLEAGAYYLVFFWKNNSSSSSLYSQPPAAIDNISIHKSDCPFVSDITVSVTDQSAEISWTEQGSAENWEIVVSETPLDNDALNSSENIVPLTTASYSATGLSSLTQYYVYVRSACSTDDKSRWESTTFLTGGIAVTTLYPDTRTNTTAMLRAKAFSIEDINYTFYYGTSRNSLSAISDAVPTVTDSIATIQLRNLTAETQYYYTAEATNSYGTVRGDTLSFITCGQITDERDGNQYYTIQIGDQTWMAQNLRFAGDIQLGTASEDTSSFVGYRYYPENAENVPTYGYLYNWTAAMNGESGDETNPSRIQGICPYGWHLPSRPEFLELEEALTGNTDAYNLDAGAMLSGQAELWGNTAMTKSENFGATGFNALPVGQNINGNYYSGNVEFWTTRDFIRDSRCAIIVSILNNQGMRSDGGGHQTYYGLSVRCVKGLLTYAYDTVKYCGESYAYHDTTITASGDYIRHIHTANDLDTTYHLHLTLYPTLTATISYSNGCHGANNGFVEVTATGGSNSYTYLWNTTDQQTSARLENLEAGEYVVNVTDAVGCSVTASQTLTEPEELTASLTAGEIACNGGTTNITNTVEGGTPTYTYAWDNSATSQNLSNVTAGTYNVTVTDANTCIATASVTISQPEVLTTSLTAGEIACNGGTTNITNTVEGGTPTYTYAWDNSATSQNLTGVTAGTYNVTVTDANSCSATASVTISQPEVLTASLTVGTIACNGGTTSITNTVEGGTPTYTYAWGSGETSQNLENVAAGTYNVTVTDANSCSATASVTISQPDALTASLTAGEIACNGGTTAISSTVEGGTTPYAYIWSNGSSAQEVSNVTAGTYSVTVRDVNGCSVTTSVSIEQPNVLTTSLSATAISCNGGTSDITNTISGGTGPYTYTWTPSASTQNLTGVTAGTYSVTVTDSHECTATSSVEITQPEALTSVLSAGSVACNGGTASITNSVSGGTTPYTFAWDNGSNTQDLSGVTAGTYAVTVSDNRGCSVTASAEITQPEILTITLNAGTIACNGGTTTISSTVEGGTEPYQYAWSTDATTDNLTNAVAGTYSVTITDANTCSTNAVTTITQPDELLVTISGSTSVCEGTSTRLTANVSGGTSGYTYAWSSGETSEEITTTNITAATPYSVTVSDANSCSATASVSVAVGTTPGVEIVANPSACFGNNIVLQANVSNAGTNYSLTWSATPADDAGLTTTEGDRITVTPTAEGSYTYTASLTTTSCSDDEPFNSSAETTIAVNPLPDVAITNNTGTTELTCNTETISLTATGGTIYAWSSGATTEQISLTTSGNYSVTVTDANTCSNTASIEITQNVTSPTVSISNTSVTSILTCSLTSINVEASGDGESYQWSGGASPGTAENTLSAEGTYTVTATADNGCTSTASILISEDVTQPTLSISNTTGATELTCERTSINVGATSNGVSYQWSDGETPNTASNTLSAAGTYTVTATGENGCTSTADITITQNVDLPNVVATASDSSICLGSSTTLTATGAELYQWSPITNLSISIGNEVVATPTETTTYTVTATAENGCTLTAEVPIVVNTTVENEVALTTCESYDWNGTTYTETGDFTQTFAAANGCDSVVTLHLTINNAVTNEISDTACGSYQWNDSTYYASGEYIQTFYTREGCDSIVTLNLTINQPTESNDTVTVCGSYEWNGTTYTESGNYQFTLPNANANGCDSIANLFLTINQPLTESVEVTACDSYQWNDSTYYASGDYEQTFIAVNGCDSVVTLHLTINSSTTSEVSAQMCSGVPYVYEGQTFTEAGTYEVTLVNANGCDSIVTLTITYANNCSGIVSGIITDENTDEPISNARVTIGNKVTRTNAEGEYSLEVLRGRKALRVSAAGFISYSRTVDIQSDTVFNASLKSPRIETDVDSLTVSSYPYLEHSDTITLSNTGSGTLIWSSITEYDNFALVEDSVIQQRSNTRSLWDSIQTFATRENAEQAIATDGFFIYTSSWMRPGEFNRYTPNGEYVETFYVENVGAIRNLSYDGTNFYGTEGTNIIFKLDLDNQTLVDSIETDIQEIRHCSFNRQDGSLLAGSWNSLYRINIENGTSEQIRNDLANVYSSAFDNLSAGGPYLWLFSQTSQNNGPSACIRQFDISTGEYTNKTHYLDDINLNSTSLAGGICASEYVCEGKFVLLADVQNPSGSNTIATFEIGRTNCVVRTGKKSGTIEPNESERIFVRANATETGDYSATIKYRAAVMGQQSRDVNMNFSAVVPECDAVQQISIATDTYHTVTLDWQPVELGDYESVSYLVFNTASQFAIDTVSGTTVTYDGLPAGNHCFTVCALSQSVYTCLSAASDTVCAEIEPIPCNVTLAFEAANDGESIFLTWNKPVGVEYFRLLRDDNGVEEVLYDEGYIDTNVVPEVTYCYTIFAYFENDICDEIVGTACTKITSGVCAEAPVITAEVFGNSVHLSWTATSDSYTYRIFRDDVAIGMTTDTTYLDNVTYGYNYCYKVESLCDYGMFIYSNEECVFVNEGDAIEEWSEDNLSVYPNPTYGQFFIEGQRIATVIIYNASGQIVAELDNNESDRIMVNCDGWNPGLYNIRIISEEGQVATRKVSIFR